MRTGGGAAVLTGLPGVAAVTDAGNFQDVTITGSPQVFLHALLEKTDVRHFEMKQPSLHDIFVAIAKPTADELRRDQSEPA